MIINKKDNINELYESIKSKSINHKIYIDLNTNLQQDFQASFGPLRGITYDLKANFMTKDFISDAASYVLRNFTAIYNCKVYDIMKSLGALFVGKTNCDEFAAGSLGVNSIYGPVFYENCYTGGSSSGAGYTSKMFVDIAFGTDTGGSCRLPALFTRVYSYKPSFGGISRYGIIEYSKSLDCVGCLFKNPFIMSKVFNYIVQYDHNDSMSSDSISKIPKELNLKIFYMDKFNEEELKILKSLQLEYKYKVSDIVFDTNAITSIYGMISCMNIFSECYKFDTLRSENNAYHKYDDLQKNNSEKTKFGKHLQTKFLYGAMLLSDKEYRNKYVSHIDRIKSEIITTVEQLAKNNVLIFPSMFPNLKDTEAILQIANLSGLPSITIPVSDNVVYQNNSPLKYSGIILIGAHGTDITLLNIAQNYYTKNLKYYE
jgi:aspartyl-tRNA(Asn)/glutamyl-tRNA(Gln) amidotransferase subunit A